MKQAKTLFEPPWKPFRRRFDKLDNNIARQLEEVAAVQTELVKSGQVVGELGDNLDNLQDELEKQMSRWTTSNVRFHQSNRCLPYLMRRMRRY